MIVRKLLLFLVPLCLVALCRASDEEFFLQGNKLYEQREYQKAFDAYDGIKRKGCRVLYNMGNCAYKLDNFPQARVFWERARVGASTSILDRVNYNISVLDAKIGTTVKESSWLSTQVQKISWLALQLLFLACWFGLFFVLWRAGWRTVFFALFLLLNIGLGMLLGMKYSMKASKKGIVMHQDVTLYAGPDSHYQVIAVAKQATALAVKESRSDWHKVSCNYVEGWVPADQVTVV